MSLYIYQIGSVKMHARGSSVEDLVFDLDRDWAVQTNKPGIGNKFVVYGQGVIANFPKVKIKGSIICSPCKTVSDQYNELASMAGRPYVDVIAYLPNECCGIGCSCDKCGNCSGKTEPVWMTTVGVLSGLSRKTEFKADQPMSTDIMSVDIELTLDPFWYPMNKYVWEYDWKGSQSDSYRTLTDLDEGSVPPFVPQYGSALVFRKKKYENDFILYNPSLWPDMFNAFEALGRNWREADNFQYRVSPARWAWPAPPTSMYMFTGLPVLGEISIQVESEVTPFTTETNTATLDLAALNTLLSPGSLLPSDIVVVTDGHMSPGYILRDGAPLVISDQIVTPDWLYGTTYPAEMLGVDNKVRFTTPDDVQAAYLHVYRGY